MRIYYIYTYFNTISKKISGSPYQTGGAQVSAKDIRSLGFTDTNIKEIGKLLGGRSSDVTKAVENMFETMSGTLSKGKVITDKMRKKFVDNVVKEIGMYQYGGSVGSKKSPKRSSARKTSAKKSPKRSSARKTSEEVAKAF